ncbi:MAG: hypothetical protein JJU29_15560 [Verrucomicrobia bacterium]|nr:hypothetical protein [Verrucomicrobiota bacterium]MCH8513383.1 hypothetical protein [Kiritimatiellia bacterium]
MPNTPLIALIIGLLIVAVYLFFLLKPHAMREALEAYPRWALPGQILTAVGLVWFAWNLWQVDFGGLSWLKNLLFVAVPVGWYLVVTFIPDLLSVRALCGVLLLAGNPLLVQTRWHGTPAQFAIGILVYLLIIKCMFLLVYPHYWKRGLAWMFVSENRARAMSCTGMGLGMVIIVCAAISF